MVTTACIADVSQIIPSYLSEGASVTTKLIRGLPMPHVTSLHPKWHLSWLSHVLWVDGRDRLTDHATLRRE